MPPSSEAVLRRILWGLLTAVMAVVAGVGIWSLVRKPEAAPARLPAYGLVPAFSLVDGGGRRVEGSDLRGMVWVASFIYTHCTDTCPVQSAEMARLQAEFADAKDFRLVSITVDPARDTSAVLAQYARRFGADPARWLFLTGGREAIVVLAREGFRLAVAEPTEGGLSPLEKAFPPEKPEGGQGSSGVEERLSERRAWGWWKIGRQLMGAARGMFGAQVALANHGELVGPVLHSARFALVDRHMRIRGYYDSGSAEALRRLREDARALLREPTPPPAS